MSCTYSSTGAYRVVPASGRLPRVLWGDMYGSTCLPTLARLRWRTPTSPFKPVEG